MEFIESFNIQISDNDGNDNDGNDKTELPIPLIHHIFDTYIGIEYKLLIHKEGSTDEDRSKVLSIELIMKCGMEDYFEDILLSFKFKRILCNEACKRGYMNTLQWAREHGCDWNSNTCSNAALNGHLNILQWAREHGCDWDSNTCSNAAENGHLNILQWAREHGCDWNRSLCLSTAKRRRDTEMIIWIESTP